MKIVYLWSFYEPYLKSFYQHNPDFLHQSYIEQYQQILNDYHGVPGSYCRWSERLGHNALLIVNNCEPMQRQWAIERNIPFDSDWRRKIALEQIRHFEPDIFFMGSMFDLYGDFLKKVKRIVKTCIGWIACPIPRGVTLTQMDAILSSVPQFVDTFRSMGIVSECVPPAFDSDILQLLDNTSDRVIPFSFVGGVTRNHKERYNLLTQLVEKTSMEVWGYGIKPHGIKEMLLNLLSGRNFVDPVVRRFRGEAWGLEMYRILHRSKITFNSHIDVAGDWCGNMRMYEATGVGTLLLTDKKSNLSELFEPDKEVIPYNSIDDAVEKLKYYLIHEEERKQIAKAGQNRTLTDYTFKNNVIKLIDIFNSLS